MVNDEQELRDFILFAVKHRKTTHPLAVTDRFLNGISSIHNSVYRLCLVRENTSLSNDEISSISAAINRLESYADLLSTIVRIKPNG